MEGIKRAIAFIFGALYIGSIWASFNSHDTARSFVFILWILTMVLICIVISWLVMHWNDSLVSPDDEEKD